ncbi:MAG: hypothetical protein OES38_23415 [Gammaproteobacteria bacterium]|nr:hypothetical protein [Gammaproteobacteria bacterium]
MTATHRVLRWLAILPVLYVSWHIALIVGMVLLTTAEAFCPPEQMVSGLCVAEWFLWVEGAIFMFGAGLAAALMVASVAVVAPAHRARVATVVFVAGLLLAAYLGVTADALKEFAAAVIAGLVTLLVVIRWDRTI